MKTKYNFLTALPVLLLLIFPETSIQTSLALEKINCHSIYLCKVYLDIGVADWIIVTMALIIIVNIFLSNGRISVNKTSDFYKVALIYMIYLVIGILYNIYIHYDLIAYLYDLKTTLYFLVIYYWFQLFCKFEFSSQDLIFVFLIMALGQLWDYLYIRYFGVVELPNLISFMPNILPLISINFVILLMICFKQHRLWLLFLLIFEVLSAFNQVALGAIFGIFATIVIVFLYQNKFQKNLLFVILFISFLFINLILPLAAYEILPYITEAKSDGLDIRRMKTLSAWDNYFMNFPIIIGKGLGATYFETVTSIHTNVFSTGVHHQEDNVKFILHSPLAIFYKFGLIGVFIIMFVLIKTSIKFFKMPEFKNDNLAKFISLSLPIFIVPSLINPGILKYAILASMLLYISDQKMIKVKK
jgi:hypothetical protein